MRVITSPQTGIVDILRPGWSSELGADYQKQSRALVIVFRCKAQAGLGQAHSGQDSLVASDSRNLGSQAGRA